MSHTPFIIASFGIAAVLLTWCALVPLVQGRKLAAQLRKTFKLKDDDHASNP